MQQLTESHKRALNSLAILTEQKLLEIELSFIKPGFHQPIHLSFLNDLSIEKKDAMGKIMGQLKDALREFCGTYEIKREENSIQREVHTRTVFLWKRFANIPGTGLIIMVTWTSTSLRVLK